MENHARDKFDDGLSFGVAAVVKEIISVLAEYQRTYPYRNW